MIEHSIDLITKYKDFLNNELIKIQNVVDEEIKNLKNMVLIIKEKDDPQTLYNNMRSIKYSERELGDCKEKINYLNYLISEIDSTIDKEMKNHLYDIGD